MRPAFYLYKATTFRALDFSSWAVVATYKLRLISYMNSVKRGVLASYS